MNIKNVLLGMLLGVCCLNRGSNRDFDSEDPGRVSKLQNLIVENIVFSEHFDEYVKRNHDCLAFTVDSIRTIFENILPKKLVKEHFEFGSPIKQIFYRGGEFIVLTEDKKIISPATHEESDISYVMQGEECFNLSMDCNCQKGIAQNTKKTQLLDLIQGSVIKEFCNYEDPSELLEGVKAVCREPIFLSDRIIISYPGQYKYSVIESDTGEILGNYPHYGELGDGDNIVKTRFPYKTLVHNDEMLSVSYHDYSCQLLVRKNLKTLERKQVQVLRTGTVNDIRISGNRIYTTSIYDENLVINMADLGIINTDDFGIPINHDDRDHMYVQFPTFHGSDEFGYHASGIAIGSQCNGKRSYRQDINPPSIAPCYFDDKRGIVWAENKTLYTERIVKDTKKIPELLKQGLAKKQQRLSELSQKLQRSVNIKNFLKN